MSTWQVAREQWVAFIEAGPTPTARRPAGPRDGLDAELQARLERVPFPTGDEETQSRPGLGGVEGFESMTTMVRTTVDDDDEDDATRVRPSGLEVSLRAPEDGLEVSLHSPSGPAHEHGDAAELRPVSGETVVMEAPLPRAPSRAPASDDDEGGWRRPEPPAAAAAPDDGLFIPALTRTVISPVPISESDEPPPDELPEPAPVAMAPPAVSGQTVIGPPPSSGPPAVSGQTVIGPAPSRPPAPEPPSASTSTTSGMILSDPDESEAAQTLIRGEIPSSDDMLEALVPRKSKVVIDPSASGVLGSVYDEDDEPEPEPDAAELDADELDADDLLEESLESEPIRLDPVVRPPAPSRPPPAREPDVAARTARPALDFGPPPPPLSQASLDAALAALPGAPTIDDGWQIDAFSDHFGALVSPLRSAAAVGEVEFIVHCAGLHPGHTVLDVGCGDGAHCIGLAARGLAVTGLDASPVQLMRASQAAQQAGVSIQLVAGDMRQPSVDGPFDAILCIGSTLGMYTDEDDRIALQHMRERLVPGGRVILHVLNRDYLVARLPARSWWQGQGCLILDEAQVFSPTSRVHVHRTVVFETGKQFEHNIGLRLYGLTELVQMCAQVGLRVLEYSGSRHTRGRFYGGTSSEIWLLAQRE